MNIILEILDKTNRRLYLTRERYNHILKHPEMQNKIEHIKEALTNPSKISDYPLEENIKYYYRFEKNKKSEAKYLKVVVKYLNGTGLIITSYYVTNPT